VRISARIDPRASREDGPRSVSPRAFRDSIRGVAPVRPVFGAGPPATPRATTWPASDRVRRQPAYLSLSSPGCLAALLPAAALATGRPPPAASRRARAVVAHRARRSVVRRRPLSARRRFSSALSLACAAEQPCRWSAPRSPSRCSPPDVNRCCPRLLAAAARPLAVCVGGRRGRSESRGSSPGGRRRRARAGVPPLVAFAIATAAGNLVVLRRAAQRA
jgi:hypothetical protein